jgi:signal transduction histidine kinase
MVQQFGAEVEDALRDLRSVARGLYPNVLREAGIAAALRAVSQHAAVSISIEDAWRGRHTDEIELAVYFSCLEALQNAAKHAGRDATVTVGLTEGDGWVGFTVEDDGVGFDPRSVTRGAGLGNMLDRMSAPGGTLRVDSSAGQGTLVTGRLPNPPPRTARPERRTNVLADRRSATLPKS